MLATIHDDTWNMLNMQHITPNSKRWDYSDILVVAIKRLKDPPTWLKVATTLEKLPTPLAYEDKTLLIFSFKNKFSAIFFLKLIVNDPIHLSTSSTLDVAPAALLFWLPHRKVNCLEKLSVISQTSKCVEVFLVMKSKLNSFFFQHGLQRPLPLSLINWNHDMGQVTKMQLSCYLVLLSVDSKTR